MFFGEVNLKIRPLNSPFRYAGGKYYARKHILPLIPSANCYCEPFAGGASIFFAKEKSFVSILNDLDEEVINTLVQIRDNVEGLIKLLGNIPANKEIHSYFKNDFLPLNDLDKAFRWFYLNRTSYSGIMKRENCYWGYDKRYSMPPQNWPDHLRKVSKKLNYVILSSIDFEQVINSVPDGTFLFVDPPYYNADQQKFYVQNFDFEDHLRLNKSLKDNSKRLNFLITYDNTPEVHELYSWCKIIDPKEWKYTLSRTDDQVNGLKSDSGYKSERPVGQEIFIRNYSHKNPILPKKQKMKASGIRKRWEWD